MPKKVPVTKTQNPLHFEDLEPHRFEDLVRRLLYGFRDWASIEPTGRGGTDDGFDIRAWEKSDGVKNVSDEGEEGVKQLEGRMWQVQCKREKSITPTKLRKMIAEGVDASAPPYGYILAAATNLTKTALDAFRQELRKKGVHEFQFWGKDYLEDQLAQPQNDDVMFTFFGLARGVTRRSRASEVKFGINNKNKLQKLIFGNEGPARDMAVRKTFLLRDINDDHYPAKEEYEDFESHRKWEEHDAIQVEPRGVYFRLRVWYASVDTDKKTFGFTRAVDLTRREHPLDATNRAANEQVGRRVERHWRHMPLQRQAKLEVFGFIAFDDILIIDEKGDTEHAYPHLYVDFGKNGKNGPFSRIASVLRRGHDSIGLDSYKLADDCFPDTFGEPEKGRMHQATSLNLPAQILNRMRHARGAQTIYAVDEHLAGVEENDIIQLDKSNGDKDIEVTNVTRCNIREIIDRQGDEAYFRNMLAEYAGRPLEDHDLVRIVECITVIRSYDGDYYAYLDYDYNP